MAEKKGKYLRGGLGPLVYKVQGVKQIVYEKPVPGSINLSLATLKSNDTFGMTASLGSAIRKSLTRWLSDFPEGDMPNRLASRLIKPLKNCRDLDSMLYRFQEDSLLNLEGFEFYNQSKLSDLMMTMPLISKNGPLLKVIIPKSLIDQEFRFPPKAYQCMLMVTVSLFRLGDGMMTKMADSQLVVFNRSQVYLEMQEFVFNIPQGCLCIVSTFLKYASDQKDYWISVNDKNFNPGSIIKAYITSGLYEKNDNRIWITMKQFNQFPSNPVQ